MKKMTKILALVLAGLLCVTTLLACTATVVTPDDEEEDEDSIDFSEYKDLSPEEVWEKLTDAKYVKISMETLTGKKTTITRNGDNAKLSADDDLTYFDYKNSLYYVADENNSYTAEELTDGWDELAALEAGLG